MTIYLYHVFWNRHHKTFLDYISLFKSLFLIYRFCKRADTKFLYFILTPVDLTPFHESFFQI